MPGITDRLAELQIKLPSPPRPVAAYVPAVRTGNLIYTAGQIPFVEGQLLCKGSVPSQVSLEQAQAAARHCFLNGLAVVQDALGGNLDRITRIVRLGVFVASDPGFTDQPKVANGASELAEKIFGESGRHARSAVGSIALPLGATVEIELIVEVL
jgi:enamine deaminase RidA (YjgF/YER057c/UK114 family)